MTHAPIYLDYNATAPLRPVARAAMIAALDATPTNASSIHAFGRTGRQLIETARGQVGALVGATAAQVIFNSGATEGNNTVLRAYAGTRILIGASEHSSIIETGKLLNAEPIPVTPDGTIDLAALKNLCERGPAPALISVMIVNNETGVINPVAGVAAIAREYGAAFHIDAVQAVGKIPVNMHKTGADFMTISAHKIGGPQGVGALIIGAGENGLCRPPPILITGGGQERSCRAGTENVAGIAGFGAAAVAANHELATVPARLQTWRDALELFLKNSSSRIQIHGSKAPRVENTICFSVAGADAQTLLMNLDLSGIALSSGSACSSGKVRTSHVLSAMGVPEDQSRGALRLSLGYGTTQSDIDRFREVWQNMAQRL